MSRDELIRCAQAACDRWWDSFGGSENPAGEWDGLDDTERDYWCHVADGVLAAAPSSYEVGHTAEGTA